MLIGGKRNENLENTSRHLAAIALAMPTTSAVCATKGVIECAPTEVEGDLHKLVETLNTDAWTQSRVLY